MLRGPQTPGEIRQNAERLHRFADMSSVEAYLPSSAARRGGRTGGGTAACARFAGDAMDAPAFRPAGAMRIALGRPRRSARATCAARSSSTLRAKSTRLQAMSRSYRSLLGRVMDELGLSR